MVIISEVTSVSKPFSVIHATPDSNHTIVSKINETTLDIMSSLNISIHHHQVGEMFIGND